VPVDHKEKAFESAIEYHLLTTAGYTKAEQGHFDQERALDTTQFIPFIQDTQPDTWKKLDKLLGVRAEEILLDDLCKAMDSRGSLDVIRHGFKCYGESIKVAYFAPAHGMNPEVAALYAKNRLTVVRQLLFKLSSTKALELTVCLNGIPIITAELKNPMTGQTVQDAIWQYKTDRDPNDLIFQFKKRTLVHFAVDPDLVYMATKLAGKSTLFLPLNRGDGMGAGNPPAQEGKYKTAYLWEQVWQRDSLLDILARFIHLEVIETEVAGRKIRKENMIFPRYHQLDAVRKLESASRTEGAGNNYLVMHSAGSGKSNSIAWLAHRLASLHDDKDQKVFDSVVVVTDRLVLDQQLQNTIYQFEHKSGVVQKIDEDSTQLASALKSGVPIIITTLQKFPFVTEKVGTLPERRYAVIVDEAHSSQSGEAAAEMKGVLAAHAITEQAKEEAEEKALPDYEEEILKAVAKRGHQPNLSFFAFTATPKYKTLETFGRRGESGKPHPFHIYSMRQAIEEGFILDVLKYYTTYKTYFKLIKSIEDDPKLDKKKAARALARFVSFHPHNLAQKSEVMIEHFRTFTHHKIGGRAKAMVVTSSRAHAVRYKQEFDKYLAEKGYTDIKTLVAFSGTVRLDVGDEYTEVGMNMGIKEKQLPERFATDEFHVLIVAEKYQTGFDQPMLHTMYVDKRLADVQAVQTLSRLNRTAPGKEDTFVLDFVNDTEEIQKAFRPYYEVPLVGQQAEPHQLYDLQAKLAAEQIYHGNEVEEFAKVFFKPKNLQSPNDHAQMHRILDFPVDRFGQLEVEKQELFRSQLVAFRNLYAFLAQIIPFQDTDLEKLYSFIRLLIPRLPKRAFGPGLVLDDEVNLKYYRLQKTSEGSISLAPGDRGAVKAPTSVGTGADHQEQIELSRLIDVVNQRFGTEFKPVDQLFFDQIKEEAVADTQIQQAARVNSLENFKYVFDKALEGKFIDRMDQNQEIFARYMNDREFAQVVADVLRKQVYKQIRAETKSEVSLGTETVPGA
jgi:type I restriction enzyme R subunit